MLSTLLLLLLLGVAGWWFLLGQHQKAKEAVETKKVAEAETKQTEEREAKQQQKKTLSVDVTRHDSDDALQASPSSATPSPVGTPRLAPLPSSGYDDGAEQAEVKQRHDDDAQPEEEEEEVKRQHDEADTVTRQGSSSGEESDDLVVVTKPVEDEETHAKKPRPPPRPDASVVAAAAAVQREEQQADENRAPQQEQEVDSEKQKKMEKQRKLLVKEVFSTERSYVKSLGVLIEHYYRPLREKKLLSAQEMSEMFSNVESIFMFHTTFLADLERVGEDGDIASVFVKLGDFLRMYTQYVSGYDKCLASVNKLRESKKFQRFLAEKRKDPACLGLDLMSFLIMPVQRIPRYEMLLREIKKNTATDSTVLDGAFNKVHDVAVQVNERKRQIEHMTDILSIQNRLRSVDWTQFEGETLLLPTRRLVRRGMVNLKCSTSGDRKEPSATSSGRNFAAFFSKHSDEFKKREVVLFNDCLLWLGTSQKFKGCIELIGALVDANGAGGNSHSLFLTGRLKAGDGRHLTKLTMSFKSDYERDQWADDIRNSMEQCVKTAAQARSRRDTAHNARRTVHNMIANKLASLQGGAGSQRSNVGAADGKQVRRRAVVNSWRGSVRRSASEVPTQANSIKRATSDNEINNNQ
eukprot:TRINITY_DN66979_c8_g2_i1.p1 TRINITY_DN66979_c8_g2~~TRINITY_DN66979_c8_g2_i1.p1  ORF type:complete len:636 (+),score=322.91 TRINITY_DN66979_c8_g2_i1:33-1940(+)